MSASLDPCGGEEKEREGMVMVPGGSRDLGPKSVVVEGEGDEEFDDLEMAAAISASLDGEGCVCVCV